MTTKVSPDLLKQPFRKNALINGDMTIWQRNPESSYISIQNDTYTADRWTYNKTGAMVHDVSRSTDVPTVAEAGRLFTLSVLIDCTTVDSSIAAGDFCALVQKIEGYNWKAIAQQDLVLSFWVKATKTGTYCVGFNNSGSDRSYICTYTVNSADTWEKKSVTISPSPSAGTWDYTNGVGLRVFFMLACGSTYQNTAGTWHTGNYLATSGQVNATDSTANNFRLTGVQLEVGSIATAFEYRTIQQELALCRRYYEKSYTLGVNPGAGTVAGGTHIVTSAAAGTDHFHDRYTVEKRANPTVTLYSQDGASGVVNRIGVGNTAATAGSAPTGHRVNFTAVDGNGYMWNWTADAEL